MDTYQTLDRYRSIWLSNGQECADGLSQCIRISGPKDLGTKSTYACMERPETHGPPEMANVNIR